MTASMEMGNGINDIFGVKHYHVKVIKKRENPLKFIISVLSYALFVWLLLIGATLLLYIADNKIRASKGDYSAAKFNAYVVLSGSMLPEIQINDIVVTKKVVATDLEVNDIITFITPDPRFGGISVTHRIIEKIYDSETDTYSYRTKGDNNNIADTVTVPDENVLGKVILKIPKLGYLQEILSSKSGLILVVIIPCLAILSYDIMKFFKKLGKKAKLIKG